MHVRTHYWTLIRAFVSAYVHTHHIDPNQDYPALLTTLPWNRNECPNHPVNGHGSKSNIFTYWLPSLSIVHLNNRQLLAAPNKHNFIQKYTHVFFYWRLLIKHMYCAGSAFTRIHCYVHLHLNLQTMGRPSLDGCFRHNNLNKDNFRSAILIITVSVCPMGAC